MSEMYKSKRGPQITQIPQVIKERVCAGCLKNVQSNCRDTGTFPLRHASRPSVARSVADILVGSRSQGEGTRIPA